MVAVVIPSWNGISFLGECLDSLISQTYKSIKIVVVDNGSSDGSTELVKRKYPQVHLIELDKNYGFAGGVNRGITYALGQDFEYVALFNNDAVADKNWLKHLVETAEKYSEAGIVASKFLKLKDRKTLDSTGDFYSTWGFPFPRGRDELDQGQYDSAESQIVFGGTGGASLYRAQMLKEIGLFDEAFFAYYEDVDISFRAQLAGWSVRYEPEAIAYHHVGGTSSKISGFARYHSIKNFYFLYLKNMPGRLFWKYLPKFLLGILLINGNTVKRLQFKPLLQANLKFVATLPLTLLKRRQVQNLRRVSLAYIDSILYKQMPPTQKSFYRLKRRLSGLKL